jgi:hypothetical protein
MQKWEIKMLFLPFDAEFQDYKVDIAKHGRYVVSKTGKAFNNVWSQAETLASEGWEIVGFAPQIAGNEEWQVPVPGSRAWAYGCSWTQGYHLVLKRPI